MKDIGGSSDLRIDPDFAFLETAEGERIGLTRSERRALKLMAAHPNRLLSRDEILDAVSEPGSDKSDRNIDFLVNRLRRKLSDNARNPRYIATRYGEGYVWIGDAPLAEPDIAGADLVICAVSGLHIAGDARNTGEAFARDLARAFTDAMGAGKSAIYAPDCPPAESFGSEAPDHAAELSFFRDRGLINCVVAVREFRTGRLIAARRLTLDQATTGGAAANRTARQLVDQIWRVTVTQPTRDVPLPVAMYASTRGENVDDLGPTDTSNRKLFSMFEKAETRSISAWAENERRLRSMLAEDPQDAELKLLLAIAIHSKYVMGGQRLFLQGVDVRAADEDEIETLVTESLPYIRTNPDHAIMAGKLLHFVQRGYDDLGRDLCEQAYADSVSVAGSLAIIGQLRGFFGEIDIALDCIEQALNLSRPGSHAHAYALIMKAQVIAGAGRWDQLKSVRQELYGVSPVLGLFMEPVFCHPEEPSVRAKAIMLLNSRERAAAQLTYMHYICARLFRDPAQGTNVMRAFARLSAGRFGPEAIPAGILRAHPGLLSVLS